MHTYLFAIALVSWFVVTRELDADNPWMVVDAVPTDIVQRSAAYARLKRCQRNQVILLAPQQTLSEGCLLPSGFLRSPPGAEMPRSAYVPLFLAPGQRPCRFRHEPKIDLDPASPSSSPNRNTPSYISQLCRYH